MPQLTPFYFVNQMSFTLFILLALVFILSKYILPNFVYLFVTRFYITNF